MYCQEIRQGLFAVISETDLGIIYNDISVRSKKVCIFQSAVSLKAQPVTGTMSNTMRYVHFTKSSLLSLSCFKYSPLVKKKTANMQLHMLKLGYRKAAHEGKRGDR